MRKQRLLQPESRQRHSAGKKAEALGLPQGVEVASAAGNAHLRRRVAEQAEALAVSGSEDPGRILP